MNWELLFTAVSALGGTIIGALIVWAKVAVSWSKFQEHVDEGPQLRKEWYAERDRLQALIIELRTDHTKLAITVEDVKEDMKESSKKISDLQDHSVETKVQFAEIKRDLENNNVMLTQIWKHLQEKGKAI